MLVRYGSVKGRPVKKAEIYQRKEHGISRQSIDADAVKIINRLRNNGFQAYIVGGAVRDLLIGKSPKDFDVATDASPNKVKKLFRNSRIIGRRFKLAHVYYQNNKIIEVATFRSGESTNGNAVYGTLEEDVLRRDFTQNALYYCPREEQIIDFVGGVKDIKARRVKAVIPLDIIFEEDPVRLIRAVKYAVTTSSKLNHSLKRKVKSSANLLSKASSSRMIEETFKILSSGFSEKIFMQCYKLELLNPLFSTLYEEMKGLGGKDFSRTFFNSLKRLDSRIENETQIDRGEMMFYLVNPYIELNGFWEIASENLYAQVIKEVKKFLSPMIAPNKDVETAVKKMARKKGIPIPKRQKYEGRAPYYRRKSVSYKNTAVKVEPKSEGIK